MALIWDLQCFGHHCSNHLMGKSWDPLQSVLANVAGWENSEVSGVEVFGKYLANCGIFQPCQGYVGMAIDPNLTQWYTLKKVVFPHEDHHAQPQVAKNPRVSGNNKPLLPPKDLEILQKNRVVSDGVCWSRASSRNDMGFADVDTQMMLSQRLQQRPRVSFFGLSLL